MTSLNEIVKKIMKEKNFSEAELGQQLGYSQPHASRLVTSSAPSKKLVFKLYEKFPQHRAEIAKAYLQNQLDQTAGELINYIGKIPGLDKIKKEITVELQAQKILGLKNHPLYALVDQVIEKDPHAQEYVQGMLKGLIRT